MTREEAIRYGKEQLAIFGEGCEHYEFIKMTIKALEQLPDIKEAYNRGYKDGQEALALHLELCKEEAEPKTGHWIPVSERLPEKEGLYLVSVKNDHQRRYSKTCYFSRKNWFARQDIIAWMPLPEPYKVESEE